MVLKIQQVILISTLVSKVINELTCSSQPELALFSRLACSEPDLGDGLWGSELARLTDLRRLQCIFLCYQTPDCFTAVDVTIEDQKTCVHISGMDKTSVTPAYASESDCTAYVIGAYNLSCPASLIGRHCEHSVPSHCGSGWVPRSGKFNFEMKIHTVITPDEEQGITLIYSYTRHAQRMTEAYPFMSFDFANRTFATPATREGRHTDNKTLQVTRVYTNGTEASFVKMEVSSVPVYSRSETGPSPIIIFNETEQLAQYFLKGYRNEYRDYSVMERDPSTGVVWYYGLYMMSTTNSNVLRPLRFMSTRFNNEGVAADSVQQWFNDTIYNRVLRSDERSTSFDTCWFEGAGNKLDVMRYVNSKARGEGRSVRVLLDRKLSADVLFLISTDEEVIAVMAPYIYSPDKYKELPNPSILVYTSVSSEGVQTQQKITYEGSTFHQVVDGGPGHDVKWFLSARNWRKILRVTPSNDVQYGSESDLRMAANQSCSISACVVLVRESWCFHTRAVAIMPDGEVLMQSPSIPNVVVKGQGKIFQDAPDMQVIMLRSRGGCQKLVYKMGDTGESVTGCPDLKWLDWFVENL